MVSIHWKTQTSADFSTAADWSGGAVPGTKDDAILDATGSTAYTVTASVSESVHSIQTGATATLSITGGTFTASAGTGTGGNAGTILVGDATTLSIGGTFVNNGALQVDSAGSGNPTMLAIATSTTLSGSGAITMTDFTYNQIIGGAAAAKLTNAGNTISGAGTIGSSTLTLVNQTGVIDATGNNALILNTGANTITNAGLIETTGVGGLTIDSATVNTANLEALGSGALTVQNAVVTNTGGLVTDAKGGHVSLQSGTITGGAVSVAMGGLLSADSGASVLAPGTFTNAGAVSINDGASLSVAGSIANSGTVTVNSAGSGNPTELVIASATTLGGGGNVVLTDFTYNQIIGGAAAAKLTNAGNTISGAGTIGSSTLTLVNQTGVIDATGNNALILNTGANTITNAGLIETTGVGGLTIDSATVNTANLEALGSGALTVQNAVVTNTGGLVTDAKGGHVSLQSGTITGGAVSIAMGGLLSADSGASELTPGTFTNAGAVSINDGASLSVAGSIANSGTMTVNSAGSGNPTELVIASATTLGGGGNVILTDFIYNQIIGGASAAKLTNAGNTISGAGTIGSSTLTLVNQSGVIDATGANALILNTGTNTITNAGLIEATGTGGLTIDSATVNTANLEALGSGALTVQNAVVTNTGGLVTDAKGGHVSLQSGTITGGAVSVVMGGLLSADSGASVLAPGTFTNAGAVSINDGASLSVAGSIANSGTVTVNSAGSGNPTELVIASATTLGGGGNVVLTDFTYNQIIGGAAAAKLTNAGNTISGAGTIGSSTLTLVNQTGVIDATGNNALILNTGANTVTNAGLIESTGTGGLKINSPISNTGTLLAHTGTLTVVGPLTNVSGTTLTGGTYEADAGATLELPQNTGIVTDKATIILNGSGSVIEAFNTTTSLEATIDSTLTTVATAGVLEILGGRNWSTKAAMSNAGTLQLGGGKFAAKNLSNTGTTTGFGTITAPITNSGVLSAQANKTLSLQGGGLTNLSGTTLTGGTYVVGAGATLQLQDNVSVVTLAATVDLAGVGATLESLNTGTSTQVTLESSMSTITTTGVLQVLGGRGYTTANAIGNSGALQLGGGTFTSGTLANAAGSSLTGFGTVASTVSEAGTVTASGGALAFSGTGDTFSTALAGTEIDFTGGTDLLQSTASLTAAKIGISGGAKVTLASAQSYGGALVLGSGTIAMGGNSLTLSGTGSTLAGSVTGTGSLVDSGGTQALNAGASLSIANWSLTGGVTTVNAILAYGGAFSESAGATLTVATGNKLTLSKASTLGGTVNGAGTLAVANATLNGLTVGGTAILSVTGTAMQTGAVTIGDATTNKATLSIAKGATYTISGAVSIVHGHSTKSSLKVIGTLIKSGVTGVSTVNLSTSDTGLIEAAVGTLDFSNKLTGTGTLKIDSGAVLEADSSAVSTLTATFNGSNATLALKTASKFAATISGYAVGDTIDLLGKTATGASINGSDQLVIVNGATTIATLQLSGTYTAPTFNIASDGNGGTNVTLLTAARVAPTFIAAMASLGGGSGSAPAIATAPHLPATTSLLSPGGHAQ